MPATLRDVAAWAAGTIVQFGRWSDHVADWTAMSSLRSPSRDESDEARIRGTRAVWGSQVEHHLLLVAAHHLIDAARATRFAVQPMGALGRDLPDARNLLEHWKDNADIFNTTPRPREPDHLSGKRFVMNNPAGSPYSSWNWDTNVGPLLLPNVPADDLEQYVRKVVARLQVHEPRLAAMIPDWAPSPWCRDESAERWEFWMPSRRVYVRLGLVDPD